jgi:hypothetical protein
VIRVRRAALLVALMVGAGGVLAFGFAGAAAATTTPSISTTQQPASATVGSGIADKATVSGPPTFTCPPQDEAGFPLGPGSTNPTFCSYPAFSGENPNDFFCTYSATTGALTQDNDAGFCPPTAVNTGGGGTTPTGTVTFNLYNNSTASGTPLFTDTENLVSGVATSGSYTTTAAGTDYWVATYNGDGTYSSATSTDSGEPVTISKASPTLSGTGGGSASTASPISDTATIGGGYQPGGSVSFELLTGGTCAGTQIGSTATVPVSGDNSYPSGSIATPPSAGTDSVLISYVPDANNNAPATVCDVYTVTNAKTTPSIGTSQQPGSAVIGSSIADKATVSPLTCPASDGAGFPLGPGSTNPTFCSYPAFAGENPNDFYCTYSATTGALTLDHDAGFCPSTAVGSGTAATGTVTFNLYNNSTGSGTPLFTDTENLVSGVATSASYTTAAVGTDYWVATYNGDSNYNAVTTSDSGEPVTITKASPTLTGSGGGSITVGSPISDTAHISGGYSPGGSVGFRLFPGGTCSGTQIGTTATVPVSGDGSYPSGSIATPTTPGTYSVMISYAPDANNNAPPTVCDVYTVNPLLSGGGGSPPSGPDGTSTTLSCAPSSPKVGDTVTCTITVTDTTTLTPTGTVVVTDSQGQIPPGQGTCTLQPVAGSSPPSASCQITFTAKSTGSDSLTASYGGDGSHQKSNGSSSITVGPASVPPTGPSGGGQIHLKFGQATTKGDEVNISVTCPSGTTHCTFTGTLTSPPSGAADRAALVEHKVNKHTSVLGKASVTVPAGKTRTLTVHLNKLGRKLLAKQGHLTVALTVVGDGKTVVRKVRFQTKHKKPHHSIRAAVVRRGLGL